MNPIWFVRMARWARQRPPMWRIKLVLGVLAVSFLLFGIEHIWGWPDWLTVNGRLRPR